MKFKVVKCGNEAVCVFVGTEEECESVCADKCQEGFGYYKVVPATQKSLTGETS